MPIHLMVDNKGAKYWVNGWGVVGRARHIGVRFLYLRELKEKNIAVIEWIKPEISQSDAFTKTF